MLSVLDLNFIQFNKTKSILNKTNKLWIVNFMTWAQNQTIHQNSLNHCYLSNLTKVNL